MAHRLFEGKEQASSYWRYRFPPADFIMQQVIDFVEKQKGRPLELAVDVGCGSGQGTVELAKHFASVVGTDVSPAQLGVALKHSNRPNITFRECVAEELPFSDSSVDLVTSMSAFHWFDRPRFLQEVHRVLKPGGCLFLFSYQFCMQLRHPDCCSETLNQICKECDAALTPYCDPHIGPNFIEVYQEAYDSIPYPVKEWHEGVCETRPMSLSDFMGLVESFSNYQGLLKVDPQKATRLSQDICQRLMSAMKVTSMETGVEVIANNFYLLASKPHEV